MSTPRNDWMNLNINRFRVTGQKRQIKTAIVADFGRNTSIHGIRHFTNKGNHILERLFWASILMISLFICFNLLLHILTRWNEGPVIVNLSDRTESIRNIPFPAITICPETKAKKSALNFTEAYHLQQNDSLPAEDRIRLEALSQICDPHMAKGLFENEQNYSDETLLTQLDELAPTPSEVLFFCKWRNEATPCLEFFQKIWTEDGSCVTFNLAESEQIFTPRMSSRSELMRQVVPKNRTKFTWSLENGYSNGSQINDTYPYRSFGAGLRGGLTVLLRLYDYDLDYLCRGPVQGFKVLLHMPNEYPHISNHYFRVPLSKETFVTVNPKVTTTAESVKYLQPDVRGCYYSSERQLKFFREYTQRNCELECMSNITLSKCGCVKFSMPRDGKTPICGLARMDCFNDALDDVFEFNGFSNDDKFNAGNDCNCLPSCTSISYQHEISQADFDYKSLFEAYKNPIGEFPGMLNARLTITFKDNHFLPEKRHELYSHADLLALCGGILAFFLGASMLSIFELIHFFSTRIFCRRKYYGESEQNLTDNLTNQ